MFVDLLRRDLSRLNMGFEFLTFFGKEEKLVGFEGRDAMNRVSTRQENY